MSPKNLSSLDTLENLSTLKKRGENCDDNTGDEEIVGVTRPSVVGHSNGYTDAFESSTRGTARYRVMLFSSRQRLPGMGFGWKRVYRFSQRTRPNHVGLLIPDR